MSDREPFGDPWGGPDPEGHEPSAVDHAELVTRLIEEGLAEAAGPFALSPPLGRRAEAVRNPLAALSVPSPLAGGLVFSTPSRAAAESAFEQALANYRRQFAPKVPPVFPDAIS